MSESILPTKALFLLKLAMAYAAVTMGYFIRVGPFITQYI